MDVYTINTGPIIDYYARQNKLKKVDGNAETADVRNTVMGILNEDRPDQDQKPHRN